MSSDDGAGTPEWWNEGSTVIELQGANPKQAGSESFERYEKYKHARTVAEAFHLGASKKDLQHDRRKGFLKLLGKTPDGKMRRKGSANGASPLQEMDGLESDGKEQERHPDSPPENSRACGFCDKPYCRICHPPVKRELDFDGGVASSSNNNDLLLKAIASLTEKVDNLATKSATKKDIDDYVKHTKEYVTGELAPLRAEISDMKVRLTAVEAKPGQPTASRGQSFSRFDPAFRRIAFTGFPDTLAADGRIKEMEAIAAKFPRSGWQFADNFYAGPRNNRKLSSAGFIEFRTEDAAKLFLDALPDRSVDLACGGKVKAKFALTDFNKQRNWALRKAEELIKAEPAATNKRVAIDFSARVVKVDSSTAFEQGRDESRGTFMGAFSALTLP